MAPRRRARDPPACCSRGADRPRFLVFKNYDVIYSYNAAESYALAIALLSDRLRGEAASRRHGPPTDRGLSRAERKEVQELLLKRGYDVGEADGAIGARTRQAISQYQQRISMTPDGPPGGYVLDSLRRGR